MTESTSNKKDITEELLARIDRLQKTVDSMIPTKSEKLAVKDDSLFFGLIVSLIVLTIPLPTDDISRFFIPLFDNINPGLSTLIIKTILFVILTISALARYYAAMQLEIEQSKDWRTANKWRYVSLETMLLGLTFILYFAIMGFSGWFLPSKVSSNINTIPIIILVLSTALLVTSDVILIVERIENKVLSFYKIKQLISQDSKQLIPLAYGIIGFGLSILVLSIIITKVSQMSFPSISMIAFFLSFIAGIINLVISIKLLIIYWIK